MPVAIFCIMCSHELTFEKFCQYMWTSDIPNASTTAVVSARHLLAMYVYIVVCCSVLQCVAVCSVLQCVQKCQHDSGSAQGWTNRTLAVHERVDPRFLALPGSESTITEVTEYIYFSPLKPRREFKNKSE